MKCVERLVIRWHKPNGQTSYGMLLSTLAPGDVLGLLGQPLSEARHPEKLCRAYAQLYDQRGGAVEIEIKEDKQGFGMVMRQKRKAEAQEMLVLLNHTHVLSKISEAYFRKILCAEKKSRP